MNELVGRTQWIYSEWRCQNDPRFKKVKACADRRKSKRSVQQGYFMIFQHYSFLTVFKGLGLTEFSSSWFSFVVEPGCTAIVKHILKRHPVHSTLHSEHSCSPEFPCRMSSVQSSADHDRFRCASEGQPWLVIAAAVENREVLLWSFVQMRSGWSYHNKLNQHQWMRRDIGETIRHDPESALGFTGLLIYCTLSRRRWDE